MRPLKTSSRTILSALEEADIIIEDPDLALPFTRMLRARELRLAV